MLGDLQPKPIHERLGIVGDIPTEVSMRVSEARRRVTSPKSITSLPVGTRAELPRPAIFLASTTLELRKSASDRPSKIRAALMTVIHVPQLGQFVEQSLRVLQVGGVEALGEPVVDFGEHCARLITAAGVAQ